MTNYTHTHTKNCKLTCHYLRDTGRNCKKTERQSFVQSLLIKLKIKKHLSITISQWKSFSEQINFLYILSLFLSSLPPWDAPPCCLVVSLGEEFSWVFQDGTLPLLWYGHSDHQCECLSSWEASPVQRSWLPESAQGKTSELFICSKLYKNFQVQLFYHMLFEQTKTIHVALN